MILLEDGQIAAIKQFTPPLEAKISYFPPEEWRWPPGIEPGDRVAGLNIQIVTTEDVSMAPLPDAPGWFAGITEDRMRIILMHENDLPVEWKYPEVKDAEMLE